MNFLANKQHIALQCNSLITNVKNKEIEGEPRTLDTFLFLYPIKGKMVVFFLIFAFSCVKYSKRKKQQQKTVDYSFYQQGV